MRSRLRSTSHREARPQGVVRLLRGHFRCSRRTSGCGAQQRSLGDDQIGQREQAEQLRLVLRKALVANLLVTKQVLDHVKRVLDLGPDACLQLLGLLEQACPLACRLQLPALARLHRDMPLRAQGFFAFVHAPIPSIAEGHRLLAMQQRAGLRHIVDVGGRGDHRVHEARLCIHTNVRLHAEVPGVALLGLMHLGIARVALVLGRAGRGDDGRVHDGARAHQKALLGKMDVDLVEQCLGQIVVQQQSSELQQRGGIGHRLTRQVDAHEVAQRLAVVQRVLQRFVGQAVPLLQAVHAQHPGNADRLAPDAPARGVQRLDHRDQPPPRHDAFHVGKKLLAPRLLLLHRVLGAGKAALVHLGGAVTCGVFTHARAVPAATLLISISLDLNITVLLAAAETDDEIGAVLRAHLLTEQFLSWFIESKATGDLAKFLKVPRDFKAKLTLAVALGLPTVFAGVANQLNVVRNDLAHRMDVLDASQVEEFARQVDRIVTYDTGFKPLKKRFVELPVKRPGVKIAFGDEGPRTDFVIAVFAFLGSILLWSHNPVERHSLQKSDA